LCLLLVLCGLLFFHGLNACELYQTESLRAILAAEFLRSGNWIVPTLYGEPLLTKPPGMYAAIALASWPAGQVSAATARLPSALAATGIVLLFYAVFARRLGRRAGLIAATLLPASVLWLARVPSAEIDLVQLAWVSAALLCFLRALETTENSTPRSFRREWLWWQLALLCVAGGLLTKWTAPAFFYLTVGPLLWWRGRLRVLFRPAHALSVMLAALPCLAWALAVGTQTGWETLYDAVRGEALPRLSPAHHTRAYPWQDLATFPLRFLAANLPWSALTLLTFFPRFSGLWDERGRRVLQLLHCWTWPNLLFWSIVPGHHLRHAMPLQPGLAGLAALVWIAWLDGKLRWPLPALRPASVFLALLIVWLATKILFVQLVLPRRDVVRQARQKGEQIAALVPSDHLLYLARLKDEGILFYYGRPARRVNELGCLLARPKAEYCLLVESEWQLENIRRSAEVLLHLRDEQGKPIVLVKLPATNPEGGTGGTAFASGK
jgi:4-amino-4-deoxy-L-arabinose transferase-like glycosyltransferase